MHSTLNFHKLHAHVANTQIKKQNITSIQKPPYSHLPPPAPAGAIPPKAIPVMPLNAIGWFDYS